MNYYVGQPSPTSLSAKSSTGVKLVLFDFSGWLTTGDSLQSVDFSTDDTDISISPSTLGLTQAELRISDGAAGSRPCIKAHAVTSVSMEEIDIWTVQPILDLCPPVSA